MNDKMFDKYNQILFHKENDGYITCSLREQHGSFTEDYLNINKEQAVNILTMWGAI